MAWVKLDDGYPQHPKMLAAGPLGRELFVAGLCHSNRFLTDGRISLEALHALAPQYDGLFTEGKTTLPGVTEKVSVLEVAESLVAVGAWVYQDGFFLIHSYEEYQPTKAEILAKRAAERERKRRSRAGLSSSQNGMSGRSPGRGSKEDLLGTDVHARARTPCPECGVGSGLHVAGCSSVRATA